MTYKVHLYGYNQLDYWTGKTSNSARRDFFYDEEADLMAIRLDGWKMHIGIKPKETWFDEKSSLRAPEAGQLQPRPCDGSGDKQRRQAVMWRPRKR